MRKIDFYIAGMRLFCWMIQMPLVNRAIYFISGFVDGIQCHIVRVRQKVAIENVDNA